LIIQTKGKQLLVYKNENYVTFNCVTLSCVEELHEWVGLLPKFGILGGAVKTATRLWAE
jgi:hypothetical protein